MADNTYNPKELMFNYIGMEHGKAKTDAIRYAVQQADLNNDTGNMAYFRMMLCDESHSYGNGLDVITIFPELLSIIDNLPDDTECVAQGFDIKENLFWIYEDLLDMCSEFYQIPFADCVNFCNDFKKRWTAYGYSPREPYRMLTGFYLNEGFMEDAKKAFLIFKACNMEKYDCAGCNANTELGYYLANNEKDKADKIAKKIENGTLKCDGYTSSVPRMNRRYLNYYILHGEYKKAAEKAYILEHVDTGFNWDKQWASFMCAYVYDNTGRGLRIYKRHWKDIENEQIPSYRLHAFTNTACFFTGLKKAKNKDNVKLRLDNTFPLYNENNTYNIDSLIEYYYKEAEEIAKKFDKRNGTDSYIKDLKMQLKNVLEYNPAKERQET